jgi:hypothetical protein
MDEPALRGVIDSLEAGWALLALDDGQRLVWPRERLPLGAVGGMAVVLRLGKAAEMHARGSTRAWNGVVSAQTQGCGPVLAVRLGTQSLNWPAVAGVSAGEEVAVSIQVDAADTDRRRQEVRRLVNDLFD